MDEEEFKVGGKAYRTRLVTLDQISFAEMSSEGGLNQRRLMELAITHADGSPVDFGKVPIGHASQMLARAMQACGFAPAADEEGNA